MEMIFVHWQVTKAVNLGENLITRGGSKAMSEQRRSGFFPTIWALDINEYPRAHVCDAGLCDDMFQTWKLMSSQPVGPLDRHMLIKTLKPPASRSGP